MLTLIFYSLLSGHFEKFGKITNIHIGEERQYALVSFETTETANKALSSPDAVCGNRFVTVAYKSKPMMGGGGHPGMGGRGGGGGFGPGGGGRGGFGGRGPQDGPRPVITLKRREPSEDGEEGPDAKRSRVEVVKPEPVRASNSKLELEQMKTQLLQKQIAHQKLLLETLDKNKATLSKQEKQEMLTKLSALSKTIDASLKQSAQAAVARVAMVVQARAIQAEAEAEADSGAYGEGMEEMVKEGEEVVEVVEEGEEVVEGVKGGEGEVVAEEGVGEVGGDTAELGEEPGAVSDEEEKSDDEDNWKR
jgi:hypothetical protein